MNINDIIKTEEEILDDGHVIKNNLIKNCDIVIIGHFGNVVSLDIMCSDVSLFSGYNNTQNIGWQIKALIELFELTEEDGYRLFTQLKDYPCRLIFEGDGGWGDKCIGFGHYMKDKFVYKKDFAKITE